MAIVDIEYEKWQKDFEDEFPDLFKGGSLTGPVTALRRDLMRTAYMAGKKASRQPVGQEPVAMYQVRPRSFRAGAGWREVDKSEYDGGKSGHYPELDWERRTLYASPPAQGFGLGQFRSAVMGWRESLDQVVANTDIPGSDRRVAAGRVRECIRLLAMIDGRDAGAGVK